jgi:hypothetical protein
MKEPTLEVQFDVKGMCSAESQHGEIIGTVTGQQSQVEEHSKRTKRIQREE